MGNELFRKVVRLSGLPPELIKEELTRILKKTGTPPAKVTKIVLRRAMAQYLREVTDELIRCRAF